MGSVGEGGRGLGGADACGAPVGNREGSAGVGVARPSLPGRPDEQRADTVVANAPERRRSSTEPSSTRGRARARVASSTPSTNTCRICRRARATASGLENGLGQSSPGTERTPESALSGSAFVSSTWMTRKSITPRGLISQSQPSVTSIACAALRSIKPTRWWPAGSSASQRRRRRRRGRETWPCPRQDRLRRLRQSSV
jgi:hypothetical protein